MSAILNKFLFCLPFYVCVLLVHIAVVAYLGSDSLHVRQIVSIDPSQLFSNRSASRPLVKQSPTSSAQTKNEHNMKLIDGRPTREKSDRIATPFETAVDTDGTQDPKNEELKEVLNNMNTCMRISNLMSNRTSLGFATRNTNLFFNEFRKVVPKNAFNGYASHCWSMNYTIYGNKTGRKVRGSIGNISFEYSGNQVRIKALEYIEEQYKGKFSSSTVCLPNIYLLGFEKCGTTYLWCLITKLMNGVSNPYIYQSLKEPYFWTTLYYDLFDVNASQIGSSYLPNYIKVVAPEISTVQQKKAALIDACPSTVIEWPVFNTKEPPMVNYCLYPSVLPIMFPRAKFIISMRNPVSLMYSAFWWSFKTARYHFPPDNETVDAVVADHTKGPGLFHMRVLGKIEAFLNCMRDTNSHHISTQCAILNVSTVDYSSCIAKRVHLLSVCVHQITNKRQITEVPLHRGIFVTHVRKWLKVIPRDRLYMIKFEEVLPQPKLFAAGIWNFLNTGSDTFKTPSQKHVEDIAQNCFTNTNSVDYHHDPALMMRKDTRSLLEKFFHPFNVMLAELLNDPKYLWKTE